MLQMARKPFMVPPLRYRGDVVKALLVPDLGPIRPGRTPAHWLPSAGSWLIIINPLGLFLKAVPHPLPVSSMRLSSALVASAFLLAASAACADSRVFIVANQADGYGVDECLARGDKCGAHAARSYCQSREFAQATAYRRVDPDEVTGAVPSGGGDRCSGHGCAEYVAITCQR
jgi:hypothetical protein